MTDNEIIKALERCSDGSGKGLIKATLDLINRQKAEIEKSYDIMYRQSDVITEQKEMIERLYNSLRLTAIEQYENGKNDAIKDVAERIFEKIFYFINLYKKGDFSEKSLFEYIAEIEKEYIKEQNNE